MKKNVLVIMMLFSLLSYSNTEPISTNIDIEALIGVDKIVEIIITNEGNIDFGNLRSYSGNIRTTKFNIKALGLENNEKKKVNIEYIVSPLTGVNNNYKVGVNQIEPVSSVEVDNQGVTTELKLSLNKEQANSSPVGAYEGSVIIRVIHTI